MRFWYHFSDLLPGPLVHYLSNHLTDSFFPWRFGAARPLAFISGVGEKNRVITSELIGRLAVCKKIQVKYSLKKKKLQWPPRLLRLLLRLVDTFLYKGNQQFTTENEIHRHKLRQCVSPIWFE